MSPTAVVTPGFSRGRPSGRVHAAFGIPSSPHKVEAAERKRVYAKIRTNDRFEDRFKMPSLLFQDMFYSDAAERQESSEA
jgi:hypothetical protein